MTQLNPMNDRIIVKREKEEEVTPGGIVMPNATNKPDRGTIIAAGPGRRGPDGARIPMYVAVGQRIVYGKYAGTVVKVDGEELLVMTEDEVFGVVEEA